MYMASRFDTVNGSAILPCSFNVFANVNGIAHLEDVIVNRYIFISLRLWA